MVVEYTRYRVGKDQQQAFEEAYEGAKQYLHESPHCVSYELSHCTEEPERYVLRVEWVSLNEHLKGFRQEPNFKKFFALVQPFISNMEEMQHYQTTAVAGEGASREKKSVA